MPYNSSTGIMTAPLNINSGGDIQQAVNYNSGDLGDCIVNGTINKWAKWKPERKNKISPLTLEERKENRFGFQLTKFTDISALISGYGSQWDYLRPRGISNSEYFRFYDFLNTTIASSGYNKNAVCFFRRSVSTFPTSYILGQGGLTFIAQWEPESQLESSTPGCIKRSEIRVSPMDSLAGTLADCYFGVIMYHANWSGIKIKTSSSTVGSSTYTSEVSFSDTPELQNFPSGVSVYPIFSVSSITSVSTTMPRDGVFALPMSPFTLDVMSAETAVQFTADINAYYARGRVTLQGEIGIVTNGTFSSVSGVSYNVYRASSLTDKTGAQIGATTSYVEPVTTSSPLTVEQSIITDNPGFLRIFITGYVSGDTTISKDFNIEISNDLPELVV